MGYPAVYRVPVPYHISDYCLVYLDGVSGEGLAEISRNWWETDWMTDWESVKNIFLWGIDKQAKEW